MRKTSDYVYGTAVFEYRKIQGNAKADTGKMRD